MGKEVVHIGSYLGLHWHKTDRSKAVEAMTFLVAVERWPDLGDRPPLAQQCGHQQFVGRVVEHYDLPAVRSSVPGFFDEAPPGFGFLGQVFAAGTRCQIEQVVCEPDAPGRGPLVNEEAGRHLVSSDDVEGVDHIGKPQQCRGCLQFVEVDLVGVVEPASV